MLKILRGGPAIRFLLGFSAMVAAAFIALATIFYHAQSETEINGSRYDRIVLGKDLIADILPPPAYVIEAYLMATKLKEADGAAAQPYLARLRTLEKDYADRHGFWTGAGLSGRIGELMLRTSDGHVRAFFKAVNERLVPAVTQNRGDRAEAYAAVSAAYEAHRRVVDEIVTLAQADLNAQEAEARTVQAHYSTLLAAAVGGGLTVLAVALGLLYAGLVLPIARMAGTMTRLAEGDDSVMVEVVPGRGELARLTQAVERLKQTVAAAFRQSQMLDQMAAHVMMAEGPDFTITYVNKASQELLKRLEAHLPVPAESVTGQSIDIFHKHPQGARTILKDPARLPHTTRIRIGDEVAELRVSAIRDRHGNYTGPLLTWELVTEQVRMAESFEREVAAVIAQVVEAVQNIHASSDGMARRQETGASRSMIVADAAAETNGRIQGVAAAAEELSASIAEIARQVSTAASVSASAMADVDGAAEQIERLAAAASEIGQVVSMIGQIASQTNLLALNATIEAARAGEAGKGFAVVASEVKALSNQTAQATEQITAQIAAIQAETGHAVDSFGRVRQVITSVNGISSSIAAAIEEQTAVTGEMTRSVAGVSSDMARVNGSIGEVTMNAIRSGAGAIDVMWSAESLKEASDRLDRAASSFLSRIRA
ncbi:methyl-accepting chemotaxis protein [Azospirillum oleiclasticum]|uniref:HAMP domain-containing protein n=3 Tax=Azospirillum oleiclasticum TaxID=2735135 RepID=A0ABX2TFM2_9PROT|nr:HAMP domain-containing protein [Azospirillum oleiclasticum]